MHRPALFATVLAALAGGPLFAAVKVTQGVAVGNVGSPGTELEFAL